MTKLTREEILNDPFAKGMNLDLTGYFLPDQTPAEQLVEAHDSNGIARQSCELNLIACALLMHQHDGANITSS